VNRIENPILTGFLKGSGVDATPAAFSAILKTFIEILLLGGVIIFIFQFMLGGIKWITSQGDEGKVKEARQQVTQALVGLVIVFLVFFILKIIGIVFGLSWMGTLKLPLPRLVS
jgi:cytochrome bd-type quinol oxidase subunit 2